MGFLNGKAFVIVVNAGHTKDEIAKASQETVEKWLQEALKGQSKPKEYRVNTSYKEILSNKDKEEYLLSKSEEDELKEKEKLLSNQMKALEGLSRDEIRTIKKMTDGASDDINSYLRGRGNSLKENDVENYRVMKKLVASSSLKHDLVVYRAVPNRVVKDLKEGMPMKRDKAFMSTSLLKGAAINFSENNEVLKKGFTILKINVKAGRGKGIYLEPYARFKNREFEFLLQPDYFYSHNCVVKSAKNDMIEIEEQNDG